ncbi:MAG: hypothetical protein M1828_000285 [Chrysothrix sp. TS-e1954]|nr:MAG: hypothetical protein M1828_000285 [Chrysothrix sp. TS-e1954]
MSSNLSTSLSLPNSDFVILDRRQSLTGYISVLQNNEEQYRVMRCDHSLLGGIWMPNEDRIKDGITVPEPVFPVFTTLEAVRLMEPLESSQQSITRQPSALVIGLGIGTSPVALARHDINTTAVEIDPVVTELARKHFDLPQDLHVVHQDAFDFLRAAGKSHKRYDFVIHDVFTGGAEPLGLFTVEFFEMLYAVTSQYGRVAINYGGDFNAPSTKVALKTILNTFKNCRAFRDSDIPNDETEKLNVDLTNIVILCYKSPDPDTAWRFRQPLEADYLQSQSRRQHLVPQKNREFDLKRVSKMHDDSELLRLNQLEKWQRSQLSSAVGHWRAMREVLPDVVWEIW